MRTVHARSRLGAFLLLAFSASLAGIWFVRGRQETPVEVITAFPAYRDISDRVTTNGMVGPVTEFQARATFPGVVDRVAVALGDTVIPGQLLATMKDPFAQSRVATAESGVAGATEADENIRRGGTQEERIMLNADLDRAGAAQDQAQHSLDLLQQLESQGAAGKGEVEAARKRLQETTVNAQELQQRTTERFSDAAETAAHDRLADAKAALVAAKAAFNNAHIASPIAGTVYSISVAPYDFVGMGADLLRITDLRQMQIRAYFDEPEVGRLKEGQEATVTWDGRPGMVWHGHIMKAPVAAMPQGERSVAECLIKLDDPNGALLPNTHVTVTVSIDKHLHVLTIPRQALQTRGPDSWVYRVMNGRLVRTPVRLGIVTLERVETTSGISRADVIAVNAIDGHPLMDHLAVKSNP